MENIFRHLNPLTWFTKREFCEPGGYLQLWKIGWPLVVLSSSNTVMLVTNRAFLAWSSPNEVAASMPAGQMFFTLMAFFLITTGFTATIVAQFHGAGNREGCVRAAWNGFYFGTGFAFLLSLILPIGGKWIFLHNGHAPEIAELEIEYFTAMVPCAAFTCMETAFFSFFTGRGKTAIVAAIKLSGGILCVFLNWLLIFGNLGLPQLGIFGGGLANSIANLSTMIAAGICFLCVDQKEYPTRTGNGIRWEYMRKLLVFGTPAGVQAFIRNSAFAVVVMMIGILGTEELAATSIALSVNMLGSMPLIGLFDATSIVTGQCIGQRKIIAAGRVAGRAFRMLSVWMGAAALLYIMKPEWLIQIFGIHSRESGSMDLKEVTAYIVMILHFAAAFNFLDALRFILMGSLRGAGDTKVSLYISIATSWLIQIPGTVYLVLFRKETTLREVWLLLVFYMIADTLLMVWRKQSGAWKKIEVVKLPPVPEEETNG